MPVESWDEDTDCHSTSGPIPTGFSVVETRAVGATQLPTELVDKIIRELYATQFVFRPCLVCSLVCRRWRDVSLPYIFRTINLPNRGRGVEECMMFFISRPHLAKLVQFVHISTQYNVDLVHLDTLIGCFFDIRELHISSCTFLDDKSTEFCRLGHHKYTLKQLTWHEEDVGSKGIGDYDDPRPEETGLYSLLGILSLFSEIIHVEVAFGVEWEHYELDDDIERKLTMANLHSAGRLQVPSLAFRRSPTYAVPIVRSYLAWAGALSNITHLAVDLLCPRKMCGVFNDTLFHVGPQLRCLHIGIPRQWEWILDSGSDSVARPLLSIFSPGLAACINLEEFSLAAKLVGGGLSFAQESPSFSAGLLTVVNLLFLVPLDHLHDLDIHVELLPVPDSMDHYLEPDFVHAMPWEWLRYACRRFSHLRSLIFWPDVEFDMEEIPLYGPCLRYELREFEAIMLERVPWDTHQLAQPGCGHRDCIEYNCRGSTSSRSDLEEHNDTMEIQ